MSASQRRKGKEGELEVVRMIRNAGWKDASRTSDGRGQQARGDVANGPHGFHIEIKRQEALNVPRAFRQIESDANPLDTPLLIHRPSRQCWMATLPLDELLALIQLRELA